MIQKPKTHKTLRDRLAESEHLFESGNISIKAKSLSPGYFSEDDEQAWKSRFEASAKERDMRQNHTLRTIATYADALLADFFNEKEIGPSELIIMRSKKSALVAAFMDASYALYQRRDAYPSALGDFEAYFNKRFNISDVSELA